MARFKHGTPRGFRAGIRVVDHDEITIERRKFAKRDPLVNHNYNSVRKVMPELARVVLDQVSVIPGTGSIFGTVPEVRLVREQSKRN